MRMSDSKSDKRRRARIQGAWNSGPSRPKAKGRASAPSESTPQSEASAGDSQAPSAASAKFLYDSAAAKRILDGESARQPTAEPVTIEQSGEYQLSVGDNEAPASVRLMTDFLAEAEAREYRDRLLRQLPWQVRLGVDRSGQSYQEPRQTCWFGLPYTYSHVSWEAKEDAQWPPALAELKERLANALGVEFNSVMCNLYRNGKDKIGWHADDEPSLGRHPIIASLTFGDTRRFVLKRKDGRLRGAEVLGDPVTVPLPQGSLLIMQGSLQEDWLHSVPIEYHDRGPRINLTFRVIVNQPNEHLQLRNCDSRDLLLSRGQGAGSESQLRYLRSALSESDQLLDRVGVCLTTEAAWSDDGSCGRASFGVGQRWPECVSELSALASSLAGVEFRRVEALRLSGGTDHLPWRREAPGQSLAVVALGNDAVQRSVDLQKRLDSQATGVLKSAKVYLQRADLLCLCRNFFADWQLQVPRYGTDSYKTPVHILLFLQSEPGVGRLTARMEAMRAD